LVSLPLLVVVPGNFLHLWVSWSRWELPESFVVFGFPLAPFPVFFHFPFTIVNGVRVPRLCKWNGLGGTGSGTFFFFSSPSSFTKLSSLRAKTRCYCFRYLSFLSGDMGQVEQKEKGKGGALSGRTERGQPPKKKVQQQQQTGV
jgi:hypothetical protein